ncbi:MAG: hypothetical protein G3I09_04485, partial [Ferrovum sp.]|nr:hypothetical protein [Ferrovum sp.]
RDDFGFGVVNGSIYAVGGDTNSFNDYLRISCCTNVVEFYDTVANAWSTNTAMPTIRDDFDASVSGGVIYAIAGSRDGPSFTANPTPPTTTSPPAAPLTTTIINTLGGGYSLTAVEAFSISTIPVPNGVVATSGATQVSLVWNAVPSATSYNIYWSNRAGVSTVANSIKISGLTAPSSTMTGLTPGAWYYYVVTAVTSAGESLPSNEVAVKL